MTAKEYLITFVCVMLVGLGCSKKKSTQELMDNAISVRPEITADPVPEPEPVVEPEPEPVEKKPFEITHSFPIYFDFDKWVLRSASAEELDKIADIMLKSPDTKILIEGHACEIGADEYNMALGEHRALAAKDYLVQSGVASNRIGIISWGEERPAGGDLEGDRRDEFTFTIYE